MSEATRPILLQDDKSILYILGLSNLLWTSNNILIESRTKQEATTLLVDMLSLHNSWLVGRSYLYRAAEISWEKQEYEYHNSPSSLWGKDILDLSFDPANHTPVWSEPQVYPLEYEACSLMRVLIPLIMEREVVGYIEGLAPEREISLHERSIYRQIGQSFGRLYPQEE